MRQDVESHTNPTNHKNSSAIHLFGKPRWNYCEKSLKIDWWHVIQRFRMVILLNREVCLWWCCLQERYIRFQSCYNDPVEVWFKGSANQLCSLRSCRSSWVNVFDFFASMILGILQQMCHLNNWNHVSRGGYFVPKFMPISFFRRVTHFVGVSGHLALQQGKS